MAHRVLYYSIDGDTTRAQEILEEWGMDSEIELVGCAHEAMLAPTPEQMEGCEGFIGEFAPTFKETVDQMADAGIRISASMSIGLNHVDIDECTARGITVANCPGYCAEDVATHAIALMLDLMRKVTFNNRDVVSGGWDPKGGYQAYRTQGRTMGLVFFGRIARKVAPIVQAMGMDVLVWAPTKTEEQLAEAGCRKAASLDELLAESDVVSLHCPLIPETEGLIGAHELEVMKPTAYLINTARGPLIDEDALVAALDANIESDGARGIRAAGLDVLSNELEPNRALIEHPRCIVTPHSAYDSVEAADNLRILSLEAVCDVLVRGERPRNAVN